MDVYEAIKKRHSVRRYRDIPLSWDVLTRIVDTARYAPTSGNLQNFKFVVVMNKGAIAEIAHECANQLWVQQPPVLIVVCADTDKAKKFYGIRGERLYAVQNAANASMLLMLAAEAEGLSTCWVGAFNEDAIKRILKIPGNIRPQAIITLGYGDEHPKTQPKYELADMFYIDKYGNKVFDWNEYMGWTSVKIEKVIGESKKVIAKAAKQVVEKVKEAAKKVKNSKNKE